MPEFISILRWIRDIVYPKSLELEETISNLPDQITGGYSQTYVDNNIYTKDYVDNNIYTKDYVDNNIYTKDYVNDVSIRQIDTIALLRSETVIYDRIYVSGYYEKDDKAFGSKIFIWDSTSVEVDNGGSIIKLNSIETGRYKISSNGKINVKEFGASKNKTTGENRAIIQNILSSLTEDSKIYIPQDIDYGYKTTDITSYINLSGLNFDVTIHDDGIGDADGSGHKAGSQTRIFYGTKQTTPFGMHDGNGLNIYGNWHPYYSINNTSNLKNVGDPSRLSTDNRRASVGIANDGLVTWLFGQGTVFGNGYTNEELSNFKILHYQTPGDTLANYAPLVIERKTGRWCFGAGKNNPEADYQFRSVTAGAATALFESLSTTASNVLRNSNGSADDVQIRNTSGDFAVFLASTGEAMRILKSNRYVGIGTTAPLFKFHVVENLNTGYASKIQNTSATNGSIQNLTSTSVAGTGWDALTCYASNGSNPIFSLKGNGTGYADGTWTGGGADYAEYFEWEDGNPENEDRRGFTVTLINGKIKVAEDGDINTIGVVSARPSIVGGAEAMSWKGKYKKDIFECYILDEDGERILNPDYDETLEYTSREFRKEWGCIGLVGKLKVYNNQIKSTSWIKLRDIDDNISEWLIK